jgi:large subunit ribosomal protein L37Ae
VFKLSKLKKSGISGRFQARYGANIRKRWKLVMERQKGGNIKCPRCETKGHINRISTGIWHCRKCGARFTGGAYYIETPRGTESFRVSKRKQRELELTEEE